MDKRVRNRLNRQIVLDTAIRIADDSGLEQLTMRRLAEDLGVKPAALYNHVASKDALIDGMIDTVMSEMGSSSDLDMAWEQRIVHRLSDSRAVAHRHPNLYRLFAERFTTHIPQVLSMVESILQALDEAGLDKLAALHAYRTLMNYTIGYCLAEIRGFSLEGDDSDLPPPFRTHKPLPSDFPKVIELAPYLKSVDHDEEFFFGLDCILSGLKVTTGSS